MNLQLINTDFDENIEIESDQLSYFQRNTKENKN